MLPPSALRLIAVIALAMPSFAQDLQPAQLSFTSGGKSIGVTAFRPALAHAPALLVIHGAGGVDAGNRYIAQLAASVAAGGYVTYLVEYFDRTGTGYADEKVIYANYDAWLQTLHDAVTFIAAQPGVDATRIGTFGYSLGAYLAVAHATRDERIRAVVELAGGVDPDFAKTIRRAPPVLIIHGRADQRVPFQRAGELESLLQRIGAPVETLYLPGERHILSIPAAFSALDAALKFFAARMP